MTKHQPGTGSKRVDPDGVLYHQPVLVEKVLELLDPKPGESYLDCTAGYGSHAAAVMERIGPSGRAVLVDRDEVSAAALRRRFGESAEILQTNFYKAAKRLRAEGCSFDLILLDLGVSSPQLESAERGFSFKFDGPLDMRMDQSQAMTAGDVVNGYTKEQLGRIIADYGEERRWRRVADAIVSHRPIHTTGELARIVRRAVGPSGEINSATRTFQALRIEVNQELTNLKATLPLLLDLLSPGGRLAVISFHSLEDRIVKRFIDRESRDCICPPAQPICTCDHTASLGKVTSRAVKGADYDVNNPRARSAKLRVAVKLKPKSKEGRT